MRRDDRKRRTVANARGIAVGVGLFLVVYGWATMRRGVLVYSNHFDMAVFSSAILVTGVIMLFIGIFPNSWVSLLLRFRGRNSQREKSSQQFNS